MNSTNTTKALFFDIDGTIISEVNGAIPSSALKALSTARQQGHMVFINTGRTYCCLSKELLDFPWDGYLCGCGTHITVRGELISHKALNIDLISQIIRLTDEANVIAIMEGTDDLYFPAPQSRLPQIEIYREQFGQLGLGKKLSFRECPEADKFIFFTDKDSHVDILLNTLSPYFDVTDRRNGFYEAVPTGYTKGTAIDFICDFLSISKQNCYVFGDSTNDLPMFTSGVAHRIAMGKHDAALDPYVTFCTKTVEEDGIAYALSQLGLC